jgi:hypothetical protein
MGVASLSDEVASSGMERSDLVLIVLSMICFRIAASAVWNLSEVENDSLAPIIVLSSGESL